jgi:hypothetical protein
LAIDIGGAVRLAMIGKTCHLKTPLQSDNIAILYLTVKPFLPNFPQHFAGVMYSPANGRCHLRAQKENRLLRKRSERGNLGLFRRQAVSDARASGFLPSYNILGI